MTDQIPAVVYGGRCRPRRVLGAAGLGRADDPAPAVVEKDDRVAAQRARARAARLEQCSREQQPGAGPARVSRSSHGSTWRSVSPGS